MAAPTQTNSVVRAATQWTWILSTALLCVSSPALAQETQEEEGEQFTEAGEDGAVLPEMVVEAENEVRQDIQKSTFEFELSAALVDSFVTRTDDEALNMSPVSGLQPHLNNLEKLASDQPPHYYLREMAGQPVATFYPEKTEGHKPKRWNLTITDFRGAPFKRFEDKGRPPSKLEWDGKSDSQEMLKPGYPYSYVFSMMDKGTNTYNHAGVSFRIPAIDYRRDGDRILEIAGDELFMAGDMELLPPGEDWLTKACDLVRRHPYSPVHVTVIAERQDLAEHRADAVASFLASSMVVPREQVETEAVQKPDLRAELDGTVVITVEHAR